MADTLEGATSEAEADVGEAAREMDDALRVRCGVAHDEHLPPCASGILMLTREVAAILDKLALEIRTEMIRFVP